MRFSRFLRSLLLCLLLAALPPGSVAAQGLTEALDRLSADSFGETEAAIALIVRSGDPRGADILEALAERRLFAQPQTRDVYLRGADGAVLNARTDAPVAALPADASGVRLNNRLRSAVQAALGRMTLLSSNPQKRLQAATAVMRARDPATLDGIDLALAREQDTRIRAILQKARALIVLSDGRAAAVQRMAAAEIIIAAGDDEGLAVLRRVGAEASGPLREVIDGGIAAVERRHRVREAAQTVWFGISLGSVLLLAAIGLAITFGVMGVINMAHGEMVMLGAYTTYVVQEFLRNHAPAYVDWSLPLAIPLAFLATGSVGVAIERGIIRFLYGRPLETLLATFGVSLILQQAVRTWFGPTNREVAAPGFMSGSFDFLGLQITYGRLWIVVFTFAVFAGLLVVLKATPLGLQMRAVTQNRRMASAMGIRTRFVDAMTFGLGSGIAGIAGVALSQIDNVSPNLGQSYIIDSFMVVVFGGVGNLWGTLVGAFSLGVANKLAEPFAGAVLGKIAILIAMILFIQKRPRGLFALKGRAVEQ